MLRELITIFSADNPLSAMGESFARMLRLTHKMAVEASEVFFQGKSDPEARTRIYENDVAVNRLERSIRKAVVSHLSISRNSPDVPYCLLLMSLIKDVERLGDYSKNLSELVDLRSSPLPEDDVTEELREVRRGVEQVFAATEEIFSSSDRDRALALIRQGRDMAHRCDTLIRRVAAADYDAATAAVLVLASRYYKRLGGHVLNILSSVVMPLHKIDYYDEKEIPEEFRAKETS